MIATIVLGILFLLGQAHEYSVTLPLMSWSGSTFGASFFTLTGMHGFHVFVGVVTDHALYPGESRGLYRLEVLRLDRWDVVLAFRRRDLGRTLPVLPVVSA